ncbi:LysE family translocator [Alkalihalobacillus sp. TS-13]|uniref:LysE family translocator n=1 Tax=Alkalihalobacillus sp. TS-13 TaxID=2842455 RepID=UPI001C86CB43|nr:LysE family translocator [Alkalihalobacillus sp. TS-13]
METIVILSFLGVAIFLTLMPGPDNLFVIVQSISQNKKAGIATALGLCTGLIVHITAATIGISAMVYQSTLAFSLVKYTGAAYLLFLAWQSFKENESVLINGNQKSLNYKSLYRKGILMNILNPKVSIFFLALLPQFVVKSNINISIQMFILGTIFLVQALFIFIIISVFSEKVRHLLLSKPFLAKRMNLFKGLLLVLIGLQIAFSQK